MRRYNVKNIYGESDNIPKKERLINDTSSAIVLDSGKCVLCGRCVTACEVYTGLNILDFNERGKHTYVGPALFHNMEDSGCIYCGKCIQACPVAAIKEKSAIDEVMDALKDNSKIVIVGPDPSIKVALGEEFGSSIGENVEGKMYKSFELSGFNEVMNIDLASDLTVLETGTELITRLKSNETLPLLTSCSHGWVNYIEQYEPNFLPHISKTKSPQQMSGVMSKHHFATQLGYKVEDIVFVSIMPCIAKKHEASRPSMEFEGIRDVDYVLTTREYAKMLKRMNIDLMKLKDSLPHGELAKNTASEILFDKTDGIIEATLKTASEMLGEEQTSLDFKEVRGHKNIKEASYKLLGKEINVAVVYGGTSIKEFFNRMKKYSKQYHFVEFMGCTGGCIDGGGQPIHSAKTQDNYDISAIRTKSLNEINSNKKHRDSNTNNLLTQVYKDWIGKPNSELATGLLHTEYKTK